MWTPRHQREALRFVLKTLEQIGETVAIHAGGELSVSWRAVATEAAFRASVSDLKAGLGVFADIDVERAVKRVRALSEGRLVREAVWRVEGIYAAEEDHVVWEGSYKPGPPLTTNRRVVRVTRIRKAR